MSPKVRFRRLQPTAQAPAYATPSAAGADLYACIDEEATLMPGETKLFGTGIAAEIPEGFVGLIYARSGLSCKQGLAPANKVGVIDSDYRGEIAIYLYNHSSQARTVKPGDRIAQLVVTPFLHADFEEADALSETARGENGFGSTGTN